MPKTPKHKINTFVQQECFKLIQHLKKLVGAQKQLVNEELINAV